MKKIISFISLASILALCAISCQKYSEEEGGIHTVRFIIEEEATRTAIDASDTSKKASVNWTNTPASYIHLYENGTEGSSAGITLSEDNKTATLQAKFSYGVPIWEYVYKAVIAGNYSSGIPSVPAYQHPAASSFDPAADVLIGYSDPVYTRPINGNVKDVKLKFGRANAITRLELKGLKAGEKVEFIQIVAQNNIAGPLNPLKDLTYDGYNVSEGSNTISLEFSENNTVGPDGTFVTYFTSWAGKCGSFGVNVNTDKSVYGKTAPAETASRIEFKREKVGKIAIDLTGQELAAARFDLVKTIPSSWDGTYIFVSSDTPGKAKALNTDAKSNGYASDVTVTDVNGNIFGAVDENTKPLSWDISNSGYLLDNDPLWNVSTGTAWLLFFWSKYLFDNNGITVSEFNFTGLLNRKYYRHIFNIYDDGVQMTSHHDGTKTYLTWNGSSFAYTSDPQSRIFLYRYNDTERESQVLSFDKESINFPIAEGRYEIGKTYEGQALSASSKNQKNLLTYTSSNPEVATVDSDGKTTIVKEGEVTITVTAAANTSYRGASASYLLRIFTPYYQKITSINDVTSGDKYLIVARIDIPVLGTFYHSFNAVDTTSYDYDVINSLSSYFASTIYDNGNKIKASSGLNATQVILEKGLLSSYTGRYTIKPVSVNKYLYCDTELSSFVSEDIKFPTYSIAFAESSGSSWLERLEQLATSQHNITFDETGIVTISSALNEYGLGGHLFYSKIDGKYSYVNLTVLDQFDDIVELMAYHQNSEYAEILKWIMTLSEDITIKDIISYFSADLYLFKYME